MIDKAKFWSDFRVGLVTFLAIGLVITGVTLAGGTKGLLFSEKTIVVAKLHDVSGLRNGSAVTMGGLVIGQIKDIQFSPDKTSWIDTHLEIKADNRHLIKTDSEPSIRTQGMLGDRFIELSMGTENSPVLPEGTPLMGKKTTDFDETLDYAKSVLNETETMIANINEGQGTIGKFFQDEKLYQALTDTSMSLTTTSKSLTSTSDEIREFVQDFKENPKKYIDVSVF